MMTKATWNEATATLEEMHNTFEANPEGRTIFNNDGLPNGVIGMTELKVYVMQQRSNW